MFAPLNIILYNVFGQGGPTLYGTEPWTFYFANGFLNFNFVFLLALVSWPLTELKVANIMTYAINCVKNFFQIYFKKCNSSSNSK